jgi:hypothetical protein
MHHISHTINQHGGGRISSPELRHSIDLCDDFTGLEADTKRYGLLALIKRGRKVMGFTQGMIELLDYYMAFTRDIDWEEGARPIVYQSIAKTSLDLGISERHIQRLEQQLFKAGAITWNDSGNHRRYGQRDRQSGAILYAYGVDLTPLAYLKPKLEERLHEKSLYDQAWMETKRQISWYRRQICSIFAEIADQQGSVAQHQTRYEAIAKPIRTYMKLEALRALLAEHKGLHADVSMGVLQAEPVSSTVLNANNTSPLSEKESSSDAVSVVNYKYTNQKQSNKLDTKDRAAPNCFQERCSQTPVDKTEGAGEADPSQSAAVPKRARGQGSDKTNIITQTGLQHITLKQTLNAASDKQACSISPSNKPSMPPVIAFEPTSP